MGRLLILQQPECRVLTQDLDQYYIWLAHAVLMQAFDDIKNKYNRVGAIEFLYGAGAGLADSLGIDPQALRTSVQKRTLSPAQIASLQPPACICVQPLFDWSSPCYLCDTSSGFGRPYHTWLHWNARHKEDLWAYTTDVLQWLNFDKHMRQDRMEVLSRLAGIDYEDFLTWTERAECFMALNSLESCDRMAVHFAGG